MGLALLGLLMLLMPISYRAGTETSHAHTIFQGIVDAIAGRSHHHPGDTRSRKAGSPALSPFAPATVPLGSLMFDHAVAPRGAPDRDLVEGDATTAPGAPDIPAQLGLSSPIESTSAIHELGSLVALLLAGAVRTSHWGQVNRLFQICLTQDPPPPRLASD